jgi:DNA-binding NtrC family response regulator
MLWKLIERLGGTVLTIHLNGEFGVGKEASARLIHRHYPHHDAGFYIFDCRKQTLLGNSTHRNASEKALDDLHAVLAAPENHVLYFSNIEKMSPQIQDRLKRLLETRFETASPWIITSNRRPLIHNSDTSCLSQNLLKLMSTISIHIPPLHERPEEIPQIISWYVNHAEEGVRTETLPMPDIQGMNHLIKYRWPGNLRQLQQVIHRAIKHQKWDKVINTVETCSINSDDTIEEIAAFYILSHAELSIQKDKILEGFIAASNSDDIGLLDLAFYNEAVSQISDQILSHNIKNGSAKDSLNNELF